MVITGRTKVLAVIGHPIGHSLSPVMHNAAIKALGLDYVYVPFTVRPDQIAEAMTSFRVLNIAGINATIPHKEILIPYLDEINETALLTGSVNTLVNRDGHLSGHSTDGEGFLRSAEDELGSIAGCKVLVLGAGGASRAVCVALRQAGCDLVIVNRTLERANALANMLLGFLSQGSVNVITADSPELPEIADACDLIVNTTSLGMTPHPDATPLPAELIQPHHRVYDLIYSPLETRLVSEARAKGATAVSGLKMLVYQGAVAFELWTGIYPPTDIMHDALMQAILGRESAK
jgi:shikimate dehydrogenase